MANDDKNKTPDLKAALVDALKSMPTDELAAILRQSGAAPTTIGMTKESMQMLIGSLHETNANSMKQALRSQRKENPNYPERSVFHAEGKFDDDGNPRAPKVAFLRPTFFQGVRLGGELETPEEISLCNRFTEDKSSREGRWTAELVNKGTKNERLVITIPSKTVDDRMENSYPFTYILRELIEGASAVNTDTMSARIAELEEKIKTMAVAVPA